MKSLLDKRGHLTSEAFAALSGGTLGADGLDTAAAHIARCPECAGKLAESLESGGLAEAPRGFAGHVAERIRALRGENKIQLVFFSLRVAAAVCAALVIVFTGAFDFLAEPMPAPRVSASDSHISDAISSGLRGISNWASTLEGICNAEKKK